MQSSVTEDRETAGSDGLTQKSGLLEEGGASDDCTTADETKGVKESTNLKPSPAPGAAETTVVPSGTPPLTPSLPYTEPHWSGTPPHQYYLTVIKSGSVVEEIDVSHKPFQVSNKCIFMQAYCVCNVKSSLKATEEFTLQFTIHVPIF